MQGCQLHGWIKAMGNGAGVATARMTGFACSGINCEAVTVSADCEGGQHWEVPWEVPCVWVRSAERADLHF